MTTTGAAIEVFEGATAIGVPRSRFLPVKTTNDLLLLRSDSYVVGEDGTLTLATGRFTNVQVTTPVAWSIDCTVLLMVTVGSRTVTVAFAELVDPMVATDARAAPLWLATSLRTTAVNSMTA